MIEVPNNLFNHFSSLLGNSTADSSARFVASTCVTIFACEFFFVYFHGPDYLMLTELSTSLKPLYTACVYALLSWSNTLAIIRLVIDA